MFEQGPIRPPAEADSLLIRTTRGCPWNKCRFCTLFEGMKFSIREVDEIKRDITAAREHYGDVPFETCFLQDGDSFAMRTNDLIEVLTTLRNTFPSLTRISSYGRAQSMMRKSAKEIEEIREAGLNMLYCGIESGSDAVLERVYKGVSQQAIIDSSLMAKQAGMSLTVFVILGLGGKELSNAHATETAGVLNTINPNAIRIMTLAIKQGTELGEMIQNGSFTMLSEVEMIEEQKRLMSSLKNIHSHYGNFHTINLLNELDGILPEDREKLLSVIDRFLNLDEQRQQNFILGKRLGHYRRLAEFENSPGYRQIESQLQSVKTENSAPLEAVFHELRSRLI